MIDLLILMLFNALMIVGIYLSTGNDMIFERPARWIEGNINYTLTKPLFNCPTCMASVHSVLPYWYMTQYNTDALIIYLMYIPALAAMSTYIANLIITE